MNFLIIDADNCYSKFLYELFSRFGHKASTINSGENAIHYIEVANPPYNAVVLEFGAIGNLQGSYIAKLTREKYPNLPIIFLSDSAYDEATMQASKDCGANGLLHKRINPQGICATVVRTVESLKN